MSYKKFEDIKELKREENLYKKLPLLIREIILDSALPLPTAKLIVENEIEQIKKRSLTLASYYIRYNI